MVLNRLDERKKSLVENNIKLVYKVVSSLGICQCEQNYNDAVQEGCMGLMFAAQNYDEDISAFSTYAFVCIKGAVQTYLCERKKTEERLPCVNFGDKVTDSDNLTFGDILAAKETLHDELDASELRRISNCAVSKMGTEKTRRIVRYYLDRVFENAVPTYKLMAVKFGVSKQWVSSLMRKYRQFLYLELQREGYNVSLGSRMGD